MNTKKLTTLSLLCALALVLSYVESLLPPLTAVPGIKIGLGNIAVVLTLYGVGAWPALVLSLIRLTLASLLFGTGVSFLYGLAGALLSFLGMVLLKKTDRFSPTGVSGTGGVLHNLGQVLVAVVVLDTPAIFGYLPLLLLTGTLSGALVGLLGGVILKRVEPLLR